MTTRTTYFTTMPTPVGELTVTSNGDALTAVYFEDPKYGPTSTDGWIRDDAVLADARRQLEEYFRGERTDFDLALAPSGTDFQRSVWRALSHIPFATTTSYGAIASTIGKQSASRAVGAANGRNPISIIVPCHRVIGSGGDLTGYGGGLDRKRWLLNHEAVVLSKVRAAAVATR